MAAQPPAQPPAASAESLKSVVLLCATAAAAAAAAGGVAYWWMTCEAASQARRRRRRHNRSDAGSGGKPASSRAHSSAAGAAAAAAPGAPKSGSGRSSQHPLPPPRWQDPVVAVQRAERAATGSAASSGSFESPFKTRQRAAAAAAAAAAAGDIAAPAAAAAAESRFAGGNSAAAAAGSGSGGLMSFAEALAANRDAQHQGNFRSNPSDANLCSNASEQQRSHASGHSWGQRGSLRSNSSVPDLALMSGRHTPPLTEEAAAPRSRSCGISDQEIAPDAPPQQPAVRLEDIEVCIREDGSLWRLGAGSFGTVYKAMLGGFHPVAVKVIPLDATDKERADFEKEIAMLESCRDRNVVQFLGSCSDGGQTLLITEFMANGNLHNALANDEEGQLLWYKRAFQVGGRPQPGLGKQIALDIARGLAFMHTHCIVHLDIKSPNVLLAADMTAKIADVGLSKLQNKDYLSAQQQVGTFTWSAPEILMGDRCTERVDIFSYGVILWELITGEQPVRGRLRSLRVPEEAPQAVADLVAQCMDADPTARPAAKDIVALLSQPDVVLDGHLPSRRQKAEAAKGRPGNVDAGRKLQKLTAQLAKHVYGEEGIRQRDWSPAAPELISQRTDMGLWTDLVAFWARCLATPDVEDRDSGTFRRLEATTSLLARTMRLKAEVNSLWAHGLRNTKSTTSAESTGGSAPDPVRVDQQAVLRALRLSPGQQQAILAARAETLKTMEGIAAERARLVEALHQFDAFQDDSSSAAPIGYNDVVAVSQSLHENMVAEGRATNACFLAILEQLTPVQLARMALASRPFMFDPIAVGELLEARAGRTDSGSLRPGSRSLLEQAMSASSEGTVSRNGSGLLPDPATLQQQQQQQRGHCTPAQRASMEGAGRISMQTVLKDALQRAASGGSSSCGGSANTEPCSGKDVGGRPSADGGRLVTLAGQ